MPDMAKMTYKFQINHFIEKLPKAQTMERIVAALDKVGIPERTFYRDRSLKAGQPGDIPSERLMKYAKFFDISIEELFNNDVQVKPIAKKKVKPAIAKTGLKR